MANKVTTMENSVGVLFHEESPVASSDLNELQTILINKTTSDGIEIRWSRSDDTFQLNSIDLKGKVIVHEIDSSIPVIIDMTGSPSVNQIHFYTRVVNITNPTTNVYRYGLRSNPLTSILGANTTAPNYIISDALNQQVSDRTLTEWTMVKSPDTATVPSLAGWTHEGFVRIGFSSDPAAITRVKSNSISSRQFSVDYAVYPGVELTSLNTTMSWSGRNLAIKIRTPLDPQIYQFDGTEWVVVGEVTQPDTVVNVADILASVRVIDPNKRKSGNWYLYEKDGVLTGNLVAYVGGSSGTGTLPPDQGGSGRLPDDPPGPGEINYYISQEISVAIPAPTPNIPQFMHHNGPIENPPNWMNLTGPGSLKEAIGLGTGNDPVTPASIGAATAEQGARADSAVQSASWAGTGMTKTGTALSITQAAARTALFGAAAIGSTQLPVYIAANGVPTALTQANLRIGLFGSAAIGSANQNVYIAANGVPTAGGTFVPTSGGTYSGAVTINTTQVTAQFIRNTAFSSTAGFHLSSTGQVYWFDGGSNYWIYYHAGNTPDAGTGSRGFMSTGTQSFAGLKTFTNGAYGALWN